jgi:hypothetical protein
LCLGLNQGSGGRPSVGSGADRHPDRLCGFEQRGRSEGPGVRPSVRLRVLRGDVSRPHGRRASWPMPPARPGDGRQRPLSVHAGRADRPAGHRLRSHAKRSPGAGYPVRGLAPLVLPELGHHGPVPVSPGRVVTHRNIRPGLRPIRDVFFWGRQQATRPPATIGGRYGRPTTGFG